MNVALNNVTYSSQYSESGSSALMTGKIITVKNVDDGENSIEKKIHNKNSL